MKAENAEQESRQDVGERKRKRNKKIKNLSLYEWLLSMVRWSQWTGLDKVLCAPKSGCDSTRTGRYKAQSPITIPKPTNINTLIRGKKNASLRVKTLSQPLSLESICERQRTTIDLVWIEPPPSPIVDSPIAPAPASLFRCSKTRSLPRSP